MKLTFLGTAAAEGIPAVFCNCPTCRCAKERGGKEMRTRSQILIDDDILFDFPMDTYMHMHMYRLDLSRIAHVLITHAHMDHCYPQEFCMRGGPFAHNIVAPEVTVHCNRTVKDMFVSDASREMRPEIEKNIKLDVLSPYDRRTLDGDTYIIALPAKHTQGEDCLVYYIERGGKGALLLNDTGTLDREVYKTLKDLGGAVDIVTLDCTYGAIKHGPGRHMGLYDAVAQLELMDSVELLRQGAKKIVTHFSHNAGLDLDGLTRAAEKVGVIAAYDGLTATA